MASNKKIITITLRLNDQMTKDLNKSASKLSKMGDTLKSTGKKLTVGLTLPILALGAAAVKTAIDFESAFTGVTKTVDGTTEQLDDLRKGILALSTGDSPVSALKNSFVELSKIAEAAGQLGVARKDILEFTDVLGQLAMSTDIIGDEGARSLAQFANAAQFDLSNIRKLGDVIVTLGNATATTENQILTFGQRMGTLSQIGFEAEELLAFGAAMASIGINAEAGASAFVKGSQQIALAAATGGEGLAALAQVSGLTEKAFAAMFKSDPAGAMQDFIEGLGTLELADQVAALEALGITGVRARAAFLGLSGDTEGLAKALQLAGDAIQGNDALLDEASKRAATTAGEMNKLQNNLAALGNEFGVILLPILNDLIKNALIPLVKWFSELDVNTKKIIIGIGLLLAVIGPLMFIVGGLMSAFSALAGIVPLVAGAFAFLMSPLGLLVAAFALFLLGLWLVVNNFPAIEAAVNGFVANVNKAMGLMGKEIENIPDQWSTNLDLMGVILDKKGKDFEKSWKGISDMWPRVAGALPGILGGIFTKTMDSVVRAVSVGMIKLIEGVTKMANGAAKAIRNAFGIASPSKVMTKIGKQVVEGFNRGVDGLGGIGVNVPQLSGAGGQPALAVGGAGGGGGNVFIEKVIFEMPIGTSQEQLEFINRGLGKLSKKRGARNTR